MSQSRWNARVVVKRIQQEFPAVVAYAMHTINKGLDADVGETLHVLPSCSTVVLRCIVYKLMNQNNIVDSFDAMKVEYGNWLLLNKRIYQWVAQEPNINELMAFKML